MSARKRFYPGDAYVDIVGIDLYPNDYYGSGTPRDNAYPEAFELMRQVGPGKIIYPGQIICLCECQAILKPDIGDSSGPKWLYCLPWWGEGKSYPAEWIRKTYSQEQLIALDHLNRFR